MKDKEFVNLERQYVTLDGQRMAYIAAGDPAAPPVVLVHGWLSHAGVWSQTLEALQGSHYCVSVDLLGFGYSEKPRGGDYSIHAHSDRTLKLADALGLKRFAWIGHSMGGQIGLYTALHAPDRLARLVNVSGVVTGRLSGYIRYFETPVFWAGALFPPMWSLTRFAARFAWVRALGDYPLFYRPEKEPPDSTNRKMAMVPGIEVPAYRALKAIAALDLTEPIKNVRAPTLTVFGKYDRTVPVQNGYLVKERVPGSQFVLIDDCGHTPMVEQPEAYLAAVKAFLLQ